MCIRDRVLTDKELEKVRFAKGTLAPKGHMYYPIYIPKEMNWEKAIKKGIKNTCNDMLAPIPVSYTHLDVYKRQVRSLHYKSRKVFTKQPNFK